MKILTALIIVGITSLNSAQAENLQFGLVKHGAGPISNEMQSYKKYLFRDIVKQQTDFSCGAAALTTILNFGYKKNFSEAEVFQNLLKTSDLEAVKSQGFSLLDMANYLQTIGLKGQGFKISSNDLDKLKLPTIILLNFNGYEHFVVLKKVKNNRAYLADPALGNKTIFKDKLVAMWNGIVFAVLGNDFDSNSSLLFSSSPVELNLLDMAAISTTEVPSVEIEHFHPQIIFYR
jgi:predicted double-glycine peptidase